MENPCENATVTAANQCVNCCKLNAQLISNPVDKLIDGIFGVFDCEYKSTLSSVEKSDCIPMCLLCSSNFISLSNSLKSFRSRTTDASFISNILNQKAKTIETAINYQNEDDCVNILQNNDEDEEKILPFDCETQTIGDKIIKNVSSPNQITNIFDYREKRLQLLVPKLVSDHTPCIKFTLQHNCTYCCKYCERKFLTHTRRREHYNSAHYKRQHSYTCQMCNEKFIQKWFYEYHLKFVHGGIELKFTCTLCGENFNNKEHLNSHNFSTHAISEHPFRCNHCDKSYPSTDEIKLLREHLLEFHKNTLEAKAARENIDQEKILNLALGENPEFHCPTCQKSFNTRPALNFHIVFDHFEYKVCQVCQEEFSSCNGISAHVEESGHAIKYCHLCENKKFKDFRALTKHLTSVHNPDQPYSFICEMCGDAFRFSDQLANHYKWHVRKTLPREFKCTQCANTFMLKHHLASHMMKVHNVKGKENPEKTIRSKKRMDQLTSNGKLPKLPLTNSFKCKYCIMTYDTAIGLSLHNRKSHVRSVFKQTPSADINFDEYMTISGEKLVKRYKCNICDQNFTRAEHCKRHLSNLHFFLGDGAANRRKRSKIKCDICNISFNIENRNRHMKLHEKRSEANTQGQQTKYSSILMKCNFCNEEVVGVLEMRRHFQNCHPDTKEANAAVGNMKRKHGDSAGGDTKSYITNRCFVCKHNFSSAIEKDKHDEIFHKKKISCHACSESFTKESECREHEVKSHRDFRCRHCDELFHCVEDFRKHLGNEHFQPPLICEFCEKHFPNHAAILCHYQQHFLLLNKSDKIHKCKDCGSEFVSANTLKTHRFKKCVNGKPTQKNKIRYKCRVCEETFNLESTYEPHLMKVHKIYAGYECEECGTLYYDFKGLSQHMRRFHGKFVNYDITEMPEPKRYSKADKQYKCPRCGLLFKKVAGFNYHMSKDHLGINLITGKAREAKTNDTSNARKYKKRKVSESEDSTSDSSSNSECEQSASDSE